VIVITEKKYSQQYVVLYTEMSHTLVFKIWDLLSGTCRRKLIVERYSIKFFIEPDFLSFRSVYFYSRHVCNKRLANWTATTDTLTLNGFTRNAKHGFNSWKWSNLA